MKKALAFLIISGLLLTTAHANQCPVSPGNAPGWNNPFGMGSGTWTYAAWKKNAGENVMYCYYQSSSLPFPQFIYEDGVAKPAGPEWQYNAPSQSLMCTAGLPACTF